MNKPRILLPLAVVGLALVAALATAALADAGDEPPPPVKADDRADVTLDEVDALFSIAPMSVVMRARLGKAEADAAIQQAEVDAMFAVAPKVVSKPAAPARDPASQRGREVYLGLCFACHLPDGKGLANAIPPLAGSDFLLADRDRAIRIVLKGLIGPVTVNGLTYFSAMPPLENTLSDQQVADVLTYAVGEWGNQGTPFTVEEVRRVKLDTRGRAGPPLATP